MDGHFFSPMPAGPARRFDWLVSNMWTVIGGGTFQVGRVRDRSASAVLRVELPAVERTLNALR